MLQLEGIVLAAGIILKSNEAKESHLAGATAWRYSHMA
jgi:hypothetical protein